MAPRDWWLPLVGHVEWRSERRDAQRPRAVWVGGQRVGVEVVRAWVEGPPTAGAPLARMFEVRDDTGRRLRVTAREGQADRLEVWRGP